MKKPALLRLFLPVLILASALTVRASDEAVIAAVRELMRRGLAAEGFKVANIGGQSESYGVINSPVVDGEA